MFLGCRFHARSCATNTPGCCSTSKMATPRTTSQPSALLISITMSALLPVAATTSLRASAMSGGGCAVRRTFLPLMVLLRNTFSAALSLKHAGQLRGLISVEGVPEESSGAEVIIVCRVC